MKLTSVVPGIMSTRYPTKLETLLLSRATEHGGFLDHVRAGLKVDMSTEADDN